MAALSSEEKMNHFTQALAARDAGDYHIARQNLEILSADSPGDPLVESSLREVNNLIQAAEDAKNGVLDPLPPLDANQVDALMRDEMERQRQAINRAERALIESEMMISGGNYDRALGVIYSAQRALPQNVKTQSIRGRLNAKKSDALFAQANTLLRNGQQQAAWESLTALASIEGNSPRFLQLKQAFDRGTPLDISATRSAPSNTPSNYRSAPTRSSSTSSQHQRAQPEPVFFETVGVDQSEDDRRDSRGEMLDEVADAWLRPDLTVQAATGSQQNVDPLLMMQKLNSIIIPSVSFADMELSRVVNSLNEQSMSFDSGYGDNRGVNIVLIDPTRSNPKINISLRNLSLKRVLDFVVDSVGFQYDVEPDAVVIRAGEGGAASNLETEFFPISRSTFIRMTGIGVGKDELGSSADPFAPVSGGFSSGGLDEPAAIQSFLQQAGVDFIGTAGSSLAYDGSAMIVTQTRRNQERIRNILNRYDEVRQVEIEAKFLEVAQGDLNELGVQWSALSSNLAQSAASSNRSIISAFDQVSNGSNIVIDGNAVDTIFPPQIPGENAVSSSVSPLAVVTGSIGDFDVTAMLRALSQKTGSDLLSAPKVTVLSGDLATITVAQELRYPQRYSDIEPEVGSGSSLAGGSGGSAGVVIAAGTPQDFTVRNVGVELSVTPRVEEDDYSITLDLHPMVTEFDGFVEYGGPSIAISSGRQVSVPSGFYQPIFSVREVKTRVTIWDGATVVMGGLTREEVKEVNDKVPFLGDIPLFGRLFQSKGESTQKRNLLIFVTANMVSPGGSLKNQDLRRVAPGSIYQNPGVISPAGAEFRNAQ
jgi:general secretion pathway protein D